MLLALAPTFFTGAAAGIDAAGQEDAHVFLDNHCEHCHNDIRFSGNWSLSMIDTAEPARGENREAWERILRMVRDGDMPPASRPQPTEEERGRFTAWLQRDLDGYAERHPDPGRATLRRLNRAEYQNAVRDLLGLDLAIAETLPPDDSGYGFDNIADVLTVSSTLMDRFVAVAGKVSRLAVGSRPTAAGHDQLRRAQGRLRVESGDPRLE